MSAKDDLFHVIAGVSNDGTRPWCAETRRILDAHRVEVAAETRRGDAARLLAESREHAGRAIFCDGIRYAASRLNEWADNGKQDPTPGFFQTGHTYQREHHGVCVTFTVTAVSTSPDGRTTVAHGWRSDPYSGWEPTDADDLTGWTDVAEAVAR